VYKPLALYVWLGEVVRDVLLSPKSQILDKVPAPVVVFVNTTVDGGLQK
jgi:hypothetical protein